MITPKEVEAKSMTESKRKEAKNSFLAFYIGRPISYVFTIPFLYLNISPNAVTVASIFLAIIGYSFLSFAQDVPMRLVGLFFIAAWGIGDGIDGNIARYKGMKSENGDFLDTLGGYLATVLILLAMGNAAYFDQEGLVVVLPVFSVMAGGISAVSTIIPRLLMHRKLARKPDDNATNLKDKESYGILKMIALNLCDPAGLQEVFIFLAIIFHKNTEFTICYCVLNIIVMIYSIYSMLEKSNKR